MRKVNRLVVILTSLITLSAPILAAAATAPLAAGPPDRRFGAIETYDAPSAATELGAGWTRIPFLWAQMQPNGTHEWLPPISDERLALEIAQGRQPVGLIITTPGWATDMNIGPGVPYGLHSGHNDPNNLWANYVRQLVATYTGRIDHWIIWNEPDVWDPAHPGYTWGGSVDDFLQLQRVAYMSIKQANPNASVILAGTSYWWSVAYGRDLYFRQYLDALVQDQSAPGNNYYCDAVALHVYFQPDFVYSITALYHQLLREHGFDKPIWIVETNAGPPSLDPQMPAPGGQFAITLDEQAAYIIQAFAMGIAGGASRIGVFKTIDTPTDLVANPEPFGLVRADGSRRPAFNAYRLATTYMAGFQSGQLEQRPDVSIVTIHRSGGATTVLWTRAPSPATVQVPAHAGSATLVDMWGDQRTISASGGVYTLQLPGATCTHGPPCIIGGPPYMIVEGAVGSVVVDSGAGNSKPESRITEPTDPKYTVNLRPIEIKGARDVWHKRELPGYQIELVTGPPFYLYQLTVVDAKITQARRSMEPLTVDLDNLTDNRRDSSLATHHSQLVPMTTLYNRRDLSLYTVVGLFDRVTGYYKNRPACDTQVTVQLNGDWAFPRYIVERQADDCPADGQPAGAAVIAFATLTPTPTPTAPPTATASPTAITPTTTAAPPPAATLSPAPPATPTQATPDNNHQPIAWLILIAGIIIIGVLTIHRNNPNPKPKP